MIDLELDELKREFLDEARQKVREIESKLDGERDDDSLDRVAYLAHQLKGAGGSYGFQRISTEAAALEKALERLHSEPKSRFDAEVQQHALNLRSEVEKQAGELGTGETRQGTSARVVSS